MAGELARSLAPDDDAFLWIQMGEVDYVSTSEKASRLSFTLVLGDQPLGRL